MGTDEVTSTSERNLYKGPIDWVHCIWMRKKDEPTVMYSQFYKQGKSLLPAVIIVLIKLYPLYSKNDQR